MECFSGEILYRSAPIQTTCSQIKEIYRDQHVYITTLPTGLGSCHYDVITERYRLMIERRREIRINNKM